MSVAADGSILFAEGNKLIRLAKQKTAVIAEDEGIDLVIARPSRKPASHIDRKPACFS